MPQPVSYNPGTPVSGSIQENNISYVVDGQNRNYRGGFGGLSWMSEVPAENNVIFIGNSTSLGRGPANIPLFYPAYNTSQANIVYAANTLPGSPRNFTTSASAYNWAVTNNFFINNSDNPIPRIDADGLVLYLDANQPSSYPQTGVSWYDVSGFGNNGTLTNGPTWNSNGWFQFDGVDDYITTPLATTSGQALTIVGVLYSTETTANYRNFYDSVTQKPMIWWDASGRIEFDAASFTTSAVYRNKWTLVALSKPAGNSSPSYYVNGELVGSGTAYTVPSLTPTWFNRAAAEEWLGNAQLVNFYSRALTTAEIKQNYFQGNIVTDGLVFMIDANNLVSYPRSGTTSYSLTGSNTATLVNGVGYSSQNGGSFIFDGVDDYIQTNLSQNTDNALITWECWYFDDSPGGYVSNTALISNYGPSGTTPFTLLHVTTDGQVLFAQRNSVGAEASAVYSGNICDGKWHHVVGTVDSTNISMYIDGVYQSSNTKITGVTTSGQNIVIGSNHLDRYQSCRIANARLYNVALTPTQIQQNYQATKDKFQGQQIVTNGLVLNLDSANKDSYPGTGTTWYDLSGNGNNGTLVNGPSFLPNVNSGIIKFDGVDDYVDGGTSTLSSGNISLFQWVKMDSLSSTGWNITFTKWLSSVDFHFAIKSGTPRLNLYTTSNSDLYANTALATGVWYYVGFTLVNGGTLTFYVNGTSDGTYGSVSRTPSNDTIYIGDPRPNYGLAGSIPITQVYNRTLSATEVAQNYNATKTRFGL